MVTCEDEKKIGLVVLKAPIVEFENEKEKKKKRNKEIKRRVD